MLLRCDESNDGTYKNRYDVTILVNGLPLIHIELKRRGVSIREAFVISNGTHTKYYGNTTRDSHIDEVIDFL